MASIPASTPEAVARGRYIFAKVFGAISTILFRLGESFLNTPVYIWVYIGAIMWMTRRLTFAHGFGSKKCVVAGRAVTLNAAEVGIAANIVDIDKIDVSFADVGGLEQVKQTLTEHIVWPFRRPELFTGKTIRSHPKGVLLYGPPGTGKTLLARALAKELGCSFINVNTDTIFSKWVGDTEKNAAAIFTLARKISPCIIFVDEIDSILSTRNANDASSHTHTKTIFMTQWDGLEKDAAARIIVVGATNRRLTIDDAIRRRMPLQIEVPPPDLASRVKILRIVLADDLEDNPNREGLIQYVALKTTNYTGSDLAELCKAAALMPLRELQLGANAAHGSMPPLTKEHFDEALHRVKASI